MKARLMTVGAVAALLVAVIAMSSSAGAGAESAQRGSPTFQGSAKLRKALTVRAILGHLRQLQSFADANGGTRAAGFPGFTSLGGLRRADDAGRGLAGHPPAVRLRLLPRGRADDLEQVSPGSGDLTEDVDFATTEFSGSGNVTAALVAVDLVSRRRPSRARPAAARPRTSPGSRSPGNIALIQRGTCAFRVKVDNAAAAGAAGVVLFNEGQTGAGT